MAECSFEYWIIQFIRMGLLFPERGVFCVTDIRVLFALHNASEDVATKAFRIKPSTTFARPLPRARIQRHNWPPTFVGSALSIRWYRLYGYFVCDLPHWSSNQQLWKVSHCGAARPWVPQRAAYSATARAHYDPATGWSTPLRALCQHAEAATAAVRLPLCYTFW